MTLQYGCFFLFKRGQRENAAGSRPLQPTAHQQNPAGPAQRHATPVALERDRASMGRAVANGLSRAPPPPTFPTAPPHPPQHNRTNARAALPYGSSSLLITSSILSNIRTICVACNSCCCFDASASRTF